MEYGAHALMWTSAFSKDDIYLFDKLGEMGFHVLEIKLSDLSLLPVAKIGQELARGKMKCTFTNALDEKSNIVSPDPENQKRGVELIKKRIDVVSDLGCTLLSGSMYGPFAVFTGYPRTDQEWDLCKKHLVTVAEYAEKKNVVLCLEPLNRYETYMLNTAEDAVKLVKEVNNSNLRILLDTYHLNIEEDNLYESIVAAGPYVRHLHLCENNRGIPGNGLVHWDQIFRALRDIHYSGYAVIESFVPGGNFEIMSRVKMWRQVAPSADAIASGGLAFFKKMEAKYLI